MKYKYLLMKKLLLSAILSLVFFSCSTESLVQDTLELSTISETLDNEDQAAGCESAEPVVKITNNSLSIIDVEVYDRTGEIVSAQFDIAIGQESDWLLFAPGSVRVLITTDETSTVMPLEMDYCLEYHGTLDTLNQLDTDEPTLVL
jgi:hypothetical protein